LSSWVPRDGDAALTQDGLILYTFGYEHPEGRFISFLKYVPSRLRSWFRLRFLRRTWRLNGLELYRPERLYTAENYQAILHGLREHLPHYVYFCPYRRREVVAPPRRVVRRIYAPDDGLRRLLRMRNRDWLQELALELVHLLSSESNVPISDFGVHGSISLGMHTSNSDIDLVVYGAKNFRRVEWAVSRLVEDGLLTYVFKRRFDQVRRNRGRFKGRLFSYGAVRKPEEIRHEYGEYRFQPIQPVQFTCQVTDDSEAMFRPAIYRISNFHPLNASSNLPGEMTPVRVVSMIGLYRNVARRGEWVEVSGVLERVEAVDGRETFFQVVVGTGYHSGEYVRPVKVGAWAGERHGPVEA